MNNFMNGKHTGAIVSWYFVLFVIPLHDVIKKKLNVDGIVLVSVSKYYIFHDPYKIK